MQGFFYNPNIYPLAEYKLRRQAVVDMAKRLNMDVMYKDENVGATLAVAQNKAVAPKGQGQALPLQNRCANCWRMRLSEAANAAKQEHSDVFSTTLLISPYQNHDEIRVIGRDLEESEKIDFYYDDFRVGFRKSQQMAKDHGVYRQKYCGCQSSIKENK